jgi:hypothetical protein
MTSAQLLTCLLVGVSQPPAEEPGDLPEGIYGLTCRVVEVRGKDLILRIDMPGPAPRDFRVKTTGESRFSLFDRVPDPEKRETVKKAIRLADLKTGQKVCVTVYSDGKEFRLVSCIASGPVLGGEFVFERVAKLGGKATKVPKHPEDKGPVRWDIDLSGTRATDGDVQLLSRLPTLARLNLSFTKVTDKGLEHLRALPDLDDLDLTGTKVTDRAAATLKRFPKLRFLSVALSGFTDKGTGELLRAFPDLDLCRAASGKKGHFRVREVFRKGKLQRKVLMIGDTFFAMGYTPAADKDEGTDRSRVATTYYHRHGPVGQVLANFDWVGSPADLNKAGADARFPASLFGLLAGSRGAPWQIFPGQALVGLWSQPAFGVVRLNAGTHAAYARPLQFFDFYNNTPALEAFSVPPKGQPRFFDFVHDARKRGANVRIFTGDERPTLARKGPKKFYSALFVEITREDLRDVNTSLMTQEGMAELMGSLRDDGILCYHTSHRYHDFPLALADAAKSLGHAWKVGKDLFHDPERFGAKAEGHFGSEWFVVARKARYLDRLRDWRDVRWVVPEATGKHLWRDGRPHDLKPLERKWR